GSNKKSIRRWYRTASAGSPMLPLFLGYFGARNSKLFTHSHKFRQRLRLHFLHHLTSMNFDGDLTGAELGGDLLVEQARDHQPHHLALARRQRLVALRKLGHLCSRVARYAIAFYRLVNRLQ